MGRLITAVLLMLLATTARAALPDDYKMVLLTENFPPFNMAADGKNYAAEQNISGINADIAREMFKRAGISYSLTLRFPWERIYNQVLEQPDQGLFSTTYTPEREPLFKWVGPLASTGWVLLASPGSPLRLSLLEQAGQYRIGAYKNDAVSQHLESKGFEPLNSLRDQENIGKLLDRSGRALPCQTGRRGWSHDRITLQRRAVVSCPEQADTRRGGVTAAKSSERDEGRRRHRRHHASLSLT